MVDPWHVYYLTEDSSLHRLLSHNLPFEFPLVKPEFTSNDTRGFILERALGNFLQLLSLL